MSATSACETGRGASSAMPKHATSTTTMAISRIGATLVSAGTMITLATVRVAPDFMTKRNSALVDIRDGVPTTPSVPRLATSRSIDALDEEVTAA